MKKVWKVLVANKRSSKLEKIKLLKCVKVFRKLALYQSWRKYAR